MPYTIQSSDLTSKSTNPLISLKTIDWNTDLFSFISAEQPSVPSVTLEQPQLPVQQQPPSENSQSFVLDELINSALSHHHVVQDGGQELQQQQQQQIPVEDEVPLFEAIYQANSPASMEVAGLMTASPNGNSNSTTNNANSSSSSSSAPMSYNTTLSLRTFQFKLCKETMAIISPYINKART